MQKITEKNFLDSFNNKEDKYILLTMNTCAICQDFIKKYSDDVDIYNYELMVGRIDSDVEKIIKKNNISVLPVILNFKTNEVIRDLHDADMIKETIEKLC